MDEQTKALIAELRECERDIYGTIYGRAADALQAQAVW